MRLSFTIDAVKKNKKSAMYTVTVCMKRKNRTPIALLHKANTLKLKAMLYKGSVKGLEVKERRLG